MATGDVPRDEMTERAAEHVPFYELPAERALELVREWRAAAENNYPADSLESTDRLAGFVRLTSGEVTGRIGRPGPDLPGSQDPKVVDEVLEAVKFVMHDGDTFDREHSRAFQSSLQRVADVCVVDAIRNVIETGKDQGRVEVVVQLLRGLCSDDCDFSRRARAQQEVAWLLEENVRYERYMDVSVDGLVMLAEENNGPWIDAIFVLAKVETEWPDTEWASRASKTLNALQEKDFAFTRQAVEIARKTKGDRSAVGSLD